MSRARFTISVLSMFDLQKVMRCIGSVMINSRDYELILTDNGAEAGIPEYFDALAKQHRHIRVVHNPKNLGFQRPNEIAFAQCDTPYFVMLNDDTVVPPGWLRELEKPFALHPRAALAGPIGNPCSLRDDFNGYIGPQVEYIEGSCCCARSEVIRKLGLWSDYLTGAYFEDQDLSLRVRQAGYTIHLVPFNLVHHRSQTSKQVPETEAWQRHNQRAMMERWRGYFPTHRFPGERETTVTLVYIHVPGKHELVAQSRRFVQSYCQNLPGYPHQTLIVSNGPGPNRELFERLPNVTIWERSNDGWDIGGYVEAARRMKSDVMVCFGTSTHFHKPNWLVRVMSAWQQHGPGFYGATASYQIRPHFNTTGFWCPPELLANYQGRVSTKADRYNFEHGPNACWIQAMLRGYPAKLVTWDGEYDWPQWRTPANIHWRGDQSNILFNWRLVDEFRMFPPSKKRYYAELADTLTDPMFLNQKPELVEA